MTKGKKIAIIVSAAAVVIVAAVVLIIVLVNWGGGALPFTNDFKGGIPGGYLEANASMGEKTLKGDMFDGFSENSALSLNGSEYTVGSTISGYAVVHKTDTSKYGVYSITENKFALNADYDYAAIESRSYEDTTIYEVSKTQYFALVYNNQEGGLTTNQGFYNLTESLWTIPVGDYSASLYVSEGYEGRVKAPNGGGDTIEEYYRASVDKDGKVQRTLITNDVNVGDTLGYDKINLLVLTGFPELKNYFYRFAGNQLIGYNKNYKQIFEVDLGSSGKVTNDFLVGKYYYVQKAVAVADDAKVYSYYDGGEKFLVKTSRVDLTSGKVSALDKFSYLLDGSILVRRDKNGAPNFIETTCALFKDGVLYDSCKMIFNKDLGEVANLTKLTWYSGGTVTKIAKNRYLSGSYIINEKAELVADLSNYSSNSSTSSIYSSSVDSYEGVVSLYSNSGKNNGYGLIDANGKLLISFSYNNSFSFVNGWARNIKTADVAGGQYQLVKRDGTAKPIEGTDQPQRYTSVSGILYTVANNGAYNTYTFTNYDGKEVYKLNSPSGLSVTNALSSIGAYYNDDNTQKTGNIFRAAVYNSDGTTSNSYITIK